MPNRNCQRPCQIVTLSRMNETSTEQLIQAAGKLANSGRWQDAERVWQEVQRREPQHPQALYSLGIHALQRGALAEAEKLLRAGRAVAPTNVSLLMSLRAVCQQRGNVEGELEAIDAALIVDAYYYPALLARGSYLERTGNNYDAISIYQNVLKIAPQPAHWPEGLRAHLQHARNMVDRHTQDYSAYLAKKLAQLQTALTPELAPRWREAASILAGKSRPYVSDSNQLYVPRLPAIPFYERAQFPWLAALEAKTDSIRAELLAVLQADRDRFTPYIKYNPGEPVNQWQELNHSLQWSSFDLWRGGIPQQENLQRCPVTAQALRELDVADIAGLCPNAMFSALAPKTHIPPHHGETNARLVAHLPLIIPDKCKLRVGFEERQWELGKALIFDDTLEHEAFNDSDELRAVLIFDTWNPLLTLEERAMVRAMTSAARDYATDTK